MTEDHPALAELSRIAQESAEAYLAGDLDTYARRAAARGGLHADAAVRRADQAGLRSGRRDA